MPAPTSPTRQPLSPSVVELEGPYTHEMIHARGIRLHVAHAGDPENPLVLLLHGSFGGWFDYRHVIAPLAARGFHVAAVDSRGYGLSDKPPTGFGYDIRAAAGDVTGLIRSLGHATATLIGTDSGGSTAWCTACVYPEKVAALISVGAAHPVDLRRAMAARPWNFLRTFARLALYRAPGAAFGARARTSPWIYRQQLLANTAERYHHSRDFEATLQLRLLGSRIGASAPAIVKNNRLLATAVPVKWLPLKVTAPTLLLEPDTAPWPELARRASRRVADGRLSRRHLPGSKNLPFLEDPEAFVDAVAQFLHATALRDDAERV